MADKKQVLELVIRAIKEGKGLEQLDAELDTLKTKLGGLKGATGDVTRALMGSAAAYLSVGGAVAGVVAVTKAVISAAAEAEAVDRKLEQVLRSTAGAAGITSKALNDLATSLAAQTTYSDESIKSAEALMLTFTKISSDVFPQAIEAALDLSTMMGGDLQGAVVQLGKSLNDPATGVTALRRVGVSFSDSQMTMIKRLVDTNDLLAAQKIVLQELGTEFGGQAAAALDTYSGQVQHLKNSWDELLETMGGKGLEGRKGIVASLDKAVVAVNEFLQKAYAVRNAMGDKSEKWWEMIIPGYNAIAAIRTLAEASKAYEKLTVADQVDSATLSWVRYGESLAAANEQTYSSTQYVLEQARALHGMTTEVWGTGYALADYKGVLSSVSSLALTYTQQAQKMAEAQEELATLLANEPQDVEGIERARKAIQDLQAEQDAQTAKWLLNIMQQEMAMDGITAAEMDFLLRYQVDTGIITEDAALRAKAAWDSAMQMVDAYTQQATFTVSVVQAGSVELAAGGSIQGGTYVPPKPSSAARKPATTRPVKAGAPVGSYARGGMAVGLFIAGDPGAHAEAVYAPEGATVYPHNSPVTQAALAHSVPSYAGGTAKISAYPSVTIVYSPMISTASEDEARRVLMPILRKGIDDYQRGRM